MFRRSSSLCLCELYLRKNLVGDLVETRIENFVENLVKKIVDRKFVEIFTHEKESERV